ncbi:hypothetical protein TNCV_5063351 [Trichonephila clavipes]|nr:hypothetical protein TNCV_5063351 [Trichonephila clavipes]
MEKKGVRYSSTQSIGCLINRLITRRLIRSRKPTRRISKSSTQRDLFFIFNRFLGVRDRDPRNPSWQRPSSTPVVSRRFEQHTGDRVIWLVSTPILKYNTLEMAKGLPPLFPFYHPYERTYDDCAAKFSSTIRNQGLHALRASLERRRGRLDESRENLEYFKCLAVPRDPRSFLMNGCGKGKEETPKREPFLCESNKVYE